MARIAFFSERLPSDSNGNSPSRDPITAFSYGLMMSLADQQHDVRVYSTYREGEELPVAHPRLQILRPFRKWSWLEVPRLLPILLDFQPELVHIVQPRAEALRGFTNALTALPSLSALMGRPRFFVSLYDVQPAELDRNRTLLSIADVIIVTNHQQADEVTKWYQGGKMPLIEIVPLPSSDSETSFGTEIEVMPALEVLADRCRDLVLIPGDLSEQREPEQLIETLNKLLSQIPTLGLVFGGGWGQLPVVKRRELMRRFEDRGHGARVLLTGPLSNAQETTCLNSCRVVFLASLSDSSLSLARWIRQSLRAERPLILRDEQCRLDPLKWEDEVNSYIVSTTSLTKNAFGQTLSKAVLDLKLRETIQNRLPDFVRSQAVDQPSNSMSRIYAQVLRTPRNPLR